MAALAGVGHGGCDVAKVAALLLVSFAGCVQPEGQDAGAASIGAEGGTVTFDDEIAIDVPRGALPRTTAVTIRRVDGARPAGAVSAIYELLPGGATSDAPIAVTFVLSAQARSGGEFRIMIAPAGTSAFTELPTEVVAGDRVRAATTYFGDVVLAARAPACHGNGACNDGNACTFNDRCVKGECRGTPYSCNDGNACTNDVCDGAGGCKFPPNSAPCDDGNACTRNDTCANGACSGLAYRCDDGNVCTDDACDGVGGCRFAPNTAPCDDGNSCTAGDTCSGGVCRAGALTCCSPGPETNCNNGIDDDCDGLVDAADPDCQPACLSYEGYCNNGIDDDCDGLVDFADPDCQLLECGADECPFGYLCFGDFYCHSHSEDGAPDYDESASDCGGADCPRCVAGQHCFTGYDCASGNCLNNVCQ